MNFMDWFVVGYLCLGAFLNVCLVGKRREAITPGVAALSLIITAVLVAAFVASHY